MTKNTIKKWKNPNVLLIGQNTYFRVFPTFWWYDLSNDFIQAIAHFSHLDALILKM